MARVCGAVGPPSRGRPPSARRSTRALKLETTTASPPWQRNTLLVRPSHARILRAHTSVQRGSRTSVSVFFNMSNDPHNIRGQLGSWWVAAMGSSPHICMCGACVLTRREAARATLSPGIRNNSPNGGGEKTHVACTKCGERKVQETGICTTYVQKCVGCFSSCARNSLARPIV